jgi:hypothetical protein
MTIEELNEIINAAILESQVRRIDLVGIEPSADEQFAISFAVDNVFLYHREINVDAKRPETIKMELIGIARELFQKPSRSRPGTD